MPGPARRPACVEQDFAATPRLPLHVRGQGGLLLGAPSSSSSCPAFPSGSVCLDLCLSRSQCSGNGRGNVMMGAGAGQSDGIDHPPASWRPLHLDTTRPSPGRPPCPEQCQNSLGRAGGKDARVGRPRPATMPTVAVGRDALYARLGRTYSAPPRRPPPVRAPRCRPAPPPALVRCWSPTQHRGVGG